MDLLVLVHIDFAAVRLIPLGQTIRHDASLAILRARHGRVRAKIAEPLNRKRLFVSVHSGKILRQSFACGLCLLEGEVAITVKACITRSIAVCILPPLNTCITPH
jgi:hypothetical protein